MYDLHINLYLLFYLEVIKFYAWGKKMIIISYKLVNF